MWGSARGVSTEERTRPTPFVSLIIIITLNDDDDDEDSIKWQHISTDIDAERIKNSCHNRLSDT